MNEKERRRYHLAQEVIRQKLTIKEFGLLTGLSYRQARRVVKKVSEKDALGIVHGNLGRTPHNKTTTALEQDIYGLLSNKYYDFNLTHFREMIFEKENISVGKNVIHRIAKKHNLVKRPKRRTKKARKPRERFSQMGQLVQFDGSEHNWFGNTVCDLIAGIDDATSKIVGAEFFFGETSLNCMKVMQAIALDYGIPCAYYLDQAGYFGKKDRPGWESQIGRALESLESKVILAGSPQAKGRVERLFNTLQDRLIAELRLAGIKTILDANKYLKTVFIPAYNKQFSVPPRDSVSAFKKIDQNKDLNTVFCKKETRKVSSVNSFNWSGQTYVLNNKFQDHRFRTITINTHIDGSVSFEILGKKIEATRSAPKPRNEYHYNKRAA